MNLRDFGLATIAAAAFTVPAVALDVPSGTYTLDKGHASLTWKVGHLGLSNYTARFTEFDSTIEFNAEDPSKSSVTATVNPGSVETDYPGETDFDAKLQGSDWFNVSEYPSITFTSTNVEVTGDNTGVITGNLTFLGVTKPVSLDVTFNGALNPHPFAQKPAIGFSAKGTIDRSEFGFDTYEPNIGGDVEILIEVEYFGE